VSFCRSTIAPCSISRLTIACCSHAAANMSGVVLLEPRRSTVAPRFSSSFATSRRPPAAAACSSPSPFAAKASTCPPFNHWITWSRSPRNAATLILSGTTMSIEPVERFTQDRRPNVRTAPVFLGGMVAKGRSQSQRSNLRAVLAFRQSCYPRRQGTVAIRGF
jgi:hypothetical protein